MELKIYNQSDVLKATVSPSSSSSFNQELMVEDAVSLSFILPWCVILDVNDYVEFFGVKYKIKKEYKPQKKSGQEYTYNVKFYGPIHDSQQVMYLNLTDGQYNPQFSLDGTPRDHLQKWVDNMNRVADENVWSIGDVIVAPNQTIEYNNLYCWDAGNSIAETFETEIWADGSVINLCRCERGDRVELGYMKGLTSLTQSENSSDVKFFTRLIPLGSTKNIDYSTYGFKRLQLPDRAKYIDRNTQYGLFEYVEETAFAEIYPHYTGTVTDVRSEEKKGEDGKSFTVYYFSDSGMQFDPNKSEIGGQIKHISFQSGNLNGRDFEANYNSTTKEWEIINEYPDEELQIPGGHLIPKIGDKYIPWNFRMPAEYEKQAELDYQAAVKDFLGKYSDDTSIYNGSTDYVYVSEHNIPLQLGQQVRLMSSEYFGDAGYRDCRMTKVSRKLENLNNATISCTNQVGKGWKQGVDTSINQLQYVVAEQQKQTVLELLKTWDTKEPTNYNVFSALRALREITNRSLSRLGDDKAAGVVTFLKGIVSGGLITAGDGIQFGKSFASGLTGHGGRITAAGHGELESLRLRRFLEVPEIRYNRVDVTTGDKWSSPGGGLIESVEMDTDIAGNPLTTGIVTLKLEQDEIGAVAFDDLCMGIYHFESGNSDTNHDDSKGNRRFAGFTTVYFRITEVVESGLNSKFRFVLRSASENYPNPATPCAMMNFVCFGNVSNKERQSSMYQTRTYTRYLKNVDWWEFSFSNIAMQFGDLSNLSAFGADMTGYSCYIDSLYFTGKIEQLEKVVENTLGKGDLRMEIDSSAGLLFVDNNIETTLTAKILRYFNDVTEIVTAWSWTRESGTEQVHIASDAIWNEAHSPARDSLHITSDDLPTDSVKFICTATVDSKTLRQEITI